MSYRVAIAGLGKSAQEIHLASYKRLSDLQVVGGCDPVARAGDFPFPLFSSVPEMLERTRPQILVVATPPDSHFRLAKLGLEAGCHIFCEKPFMNTLEEQEIVNNQFRFMRIHRAAREKLGSPDFGDLLFL